MAYMSQALADGLRSRLGIFMDDDFDGPVNLASLGALGAQFETLGDIAVKELAGEALTEEENRLITECLGAIECMNTESPYNQPAGEMPKPPVIAAVSGSQNEVLEVGVGWVDRLYVAVPLEGGMQVAQGGVFSYYEFRQPRSQRLTDDEWREMLSGSRAPDLPSWAANFVLLGGEPVEPLAFRVGDVYVITQSGDELNVREQPSLQSDIKRVLQVNDYIEISDGPVTADDYTWWQLSLPGGDVLGWAVEDQEWYERSYLP
jgi:hypothetical protein